jgi:hypothetical protein
MGWVVELEEEADVTALMGWVVVLEAVTARTLP